MRSSILPEFFFRQIGRKGEKEEIGNKEKKPSRFSTTIQ
jgi:hypothetical protein